MTIAHKLVESASLDISTWFGFHDVSLEYPDQLTTVIKLPRVKLALISDKDYIDSFYSVATIAKIPSISVVNK